MDIVLLLAIPVFLLSIVLEWWWLRRLPRASALGYERHDTVTSLVLGVSNVILAGVCKLAMLPIYTWVAKHSLPLGGAHWPFAAALLLQDLCYYAFHRSHHRFSVLWAAHVIHHSSTRYNLSTALRQSWLTPMTAPWFLLPMACAGIPASTIYLTDAVSLIFQFFIHTELVRHLGPLEYVLNTPSHHRVHHGQNSPYIDKNHGGILIIWDRLFGTFAAEREAVQYGVTYPPHSPTLRAAAFTELSSLWASARQRPTWFGRWCRLWARPSHADYPTPLRPPAN